jgi:uncharacterized membrane protein
MLGSVVSLPLVMIFSGFVFCKKSPENINMFFGYRSSMSMKNKNTWDFAHKHIGKLWRVIGCILFLLSIGAMLLCLEKNKKYIETSIVIILVVQSISIIATVIMTEKKLKNNFDKDGNYK